MNGETARRLADELVVVGFICVLESTPTTDVISENRPVRHAAGDDILQQLAQPRSALERDTALGGIGVQDDLEP